MKRLWMIDAGHGGVDSTGTYHTPGKKQYHFTQHNHTAYEGEFNRKVAAELMNLLKQAGKDYEYLTPGHIDIPLSQRVGKANELFALNDKAVYLSLHANSKSTEIKGEGHTAHGDEIYTSPSTTPLINWPVFLPKCTKPIFPIELTG